jgi:signal transduction histidine kinase/ActR/RegA family two-component response regulator
VTNPDHHDASADRLRQQTVLAKFGELALRSDDPDEILTEACRLIGEGLGTDLAKVMALQEDGETLLVRAGVGWKPGIVGELTLRVADNTSEGLALKTGKPMISPNIATETRFEYPAFLVDNGVQAVANVVIIGGEGKPPFGILQIDSRVPRQFTDDDTVFLRSYANLIAAAVDRLRVIGEMRDGQERLRLAMEAGKLGSWELDPADGTMTNTPRVMEIFGYDNPLPKWTYAELLEQVIPPDREQVEHTFRQAVSAGMEWHFECRIRRANDGQIRWIEARGKATSGRGKATGVRGNAPPTHVLGIVGDITERKANEAELEGKISLRTQELVEASGVRDDAERASRAKSRFLASMSHELRTPLNGVLGYAHLLRNEGGLNPSQSQRVDAMLGAGSHLLRMINRVLDFSEIEAGDIILQQDCFSLQEVAQNCLDLIEPSAHEKGLTTGLILSPGVPDNIVSDSTRLRQILLNLLGNAVKFTTTGGVELRLGVSADGFKVRLEVADTGPGISADQRHRLFQDFERIDIDANAIEGAGLGLAISGRLTELLGGRLAYIENVPRGSVFWLELPLRAEESPPTVDAVLTAPIVGVDRLPVHVAAAAPDVLQILVVDDVAMNLDIAASFLRVAGHSAICAQGGEEAVSAASVADFDVVLMDVRMPDVDGLEATRRIRRLAGTRGKVPIVALTAQAFADQVAVCRAAGMDEHLAKPFTLERLLETLLRAIQVGKARDMVSG